jgi:hypothetical protein
MSCSARKVIEQELAATGLPWETEAGKKHLKFRLNGRLIGVMPAKGKGSDSEGGRRVTLNIRSNARRIAREMLEARIAT